MRNTRARRIAVLTLTAITAAGSIAACASSSSPSSSSSSSAAAAAGASAAAGPGGPGSAANRAKLVACLKQHGVTLPSRPPAGGQGPGAGAGTRTAPGAGGIPPTGSGSGRRRGFFGGGQASSKFRAAFQACGAGQGFRRGGGPPQRASITKFVTCVRQHGYDLPTPNFSGKGSVFPAKLQSNSKFKAASRACQSQLAPAAGSPAGAGGAPPSGA